MCSERAHSIFCSLNSEELAIVNREKQCKIIDKGETIFQEGAFAKGIFCIEKGKFKLWQLAADGKDQILHFAKEGDVMGYRASLSGDLYSCSATALEKSQICYIPKDVFVQLVGKNSKLALEIIHLFSNELKKIESNLTKFTQRPVKERVAQSLVLLKNKYGFEADQKTINISIKREDLANMAGTTRETATRVLYHLQEMNIIRLVGKKIIINELTLLMEEGNLLDY